MERKWKLDFPKVSQEALCPWGQPEIPISISFPFPFSLGTFPKLTFII